VETPIGRKAPNRIRLAELTSGVGAVVLGVGLGAIAGRWLSSLGLPLLIVGLLLHGWGMLDKHRLEAGKFENVWWSSALYWACWLLLLALAGYLAARVGRLL